MNTIKSWCLVRMLRRMFGFARIFCAIAFPLFLLGFLPARFAVPSAIHTSAPVEFRPNAFLVSSDIHPASGDLRLATLKGSIGINEGRAGSPDLDRLNRETLLPSILLTYVIALIVCDVLWRLCRNIERNEIFTAPNLRLIRWLGVVVALSAPLGTLVRNWTEHRLTEFALRHMTFAGLEVEPTAFRWFESTVLSFLNNLGPLITGLLILVLAEVFRQGLALKQDAELTV